MYTHIYKYIDTTYMPHTYELCIHRYMNADSHVIHTNTYIYVYHIHATYIHTYVHIYMNAGGYVSLRAARSQPLC